MESLSNKDSNRNTTDSYCLPTLWKSAKQPQIFLSNAFDPAEHEYDAKLSESRYQVKDSSSTEQSHHAAAILARSNFHMPNFSLHPGSIETYKKREEVARPPVPNENADLVSCQFQTEHNRSLTCLTYPLAGSYFGVTGSYQPNSIIYPQMMGITPARVVLPLDSTEGIPVYVNAKQYHAILRRRHTRAKMEAQNKLARSRKPYIHESRHLHALKRARGSGGRFLNTKTDHPKPSTQTYSKNLCLRPEPEIQQLSESNSWEASTTSGSDISCIFNGDDIFSAT